MTQFGRAELKLSCGCSTPTCATPSRCSAVLGRERLDGRRAVAHHLALCAGQWPGCPPDSPPSQPFLPHLAAPHPSALRALTFRPNARTAIAAATGYLPHQARTKKKARVVGTNFLPVLLEDLEPRAIPKVWGGSGESSGWGNGDRFDALLGADADDAAGGGAGGAGAGIELTVGRRSVQVRGRRGKGVLVGPGLGSDGACAAMGAVRAC